MKKIAECYRGAELLRLCIDLFAVLDGRPVYRRDGKVNIYADKRVRVTTALLAGGVRGFFVEIYDRSKPASPWRNVAFFYAYGSAYRYNAGQWCDYVVERCQELLNKELAEVDVRWEERYRPLKDEPAFPLHISCDGREWSGYPEP